MRKEMKLRDVVPMFIDAKKKYRKPSVLLSYSQISNRTLIPLLGDKLVSEIGTYEYHQLQQMCEEMGHSVKTIVSHRALLIGVLKFASYLKFRDEPEKPAPIPLPEYENTKPLTPEQVTKLLVEIDHPDVYDMAVVALRMGLRMGELRALQWKHFESFDPEWRVKISESMGDGLPIASCKGKEKRTLRVWSNVVQVLQGRKHRSKFVFFNRFSPGHESQPIGYYVAHTRLVAAAKRAGVWQPEFGFHALRHTYATELAKVHDMTAFRLQGLLGHRHISTSMRYIAMQSRDIEGDRDPLAETFGNQGPYRSTNLRLAK